MSNQATTRTCLDVIRDALRELSPAEVPHLDEVWDAYLTDPVPPEWRPAADPAHASSAWAPLVVAFLGKVYAGVAIGTAMGAIDKRDTGVLARWRDRWRRRRAARALATSPAPMFTTAQLRIIHDYAIQVADGRGHTDADQRLFADKIVSAAVRAST